MSVRELLRDNDERFRGAARGLTAHDWSQPSMCDEWTNHEVLAHLVIGLSASLGSVGGAMARHRGSFDAANAQMAQALAIRRSPAQLLDDFELLSSERRGLGRYFPSRLHLGDHVTHELDIVFALDREQEIAPDVLTVVLKTQVAVPNPFVPAFRNSRGLRLRATDTGWRHGESGPTVKGSAADLVSVLGSRPKALSRLSGDGVALLERRLSRRSRMAG
jgi:uncharacterized protein (TIGR03083 family)